MIDSFDKQSGGGSAAQRQADSSPDVSKAELDDQGTDQSEALQILKHIRDKAFDGSEEKLALALGRPTEEIADWTSGVKNIDGDVLMKARMLARERGLEVE